MDDMDDRNTYPQDGSDPIEQDQDEETEQGTNGGPTSTKGLRSRYDEDEDDEDDEEDEEEEEEEEEEGDAGRKGKKRTKRRHKRATGVSRFVDIEAEVSDEEEEEEEEEEVAEGFIDSVDDIDDDRARRKYAQLDRQREGEERSADEIAKDLRQRYRRTTVQYSGDMNEIPQRLLMPSVHDPSLWQVKVRPGRERDIVFSLMRKAIDLEYTAHPLGIFSAFQRDSLPGMIYVEAPSSLQVQHACNGLVGVFLGRGIQLVPINEMSSLLQIKKQDLTITPGSWVRIRRGRYAGDLAQVVDITENGEDVGLKFIPRIDLNPKDDGSLDSAKKRKRQTAASGIMRPPQRLFNYEEIVKIYGRKQVVKRNHLYVFQNDTYKDGFIEKDFKLSALISEDVNPTLDEIQQFSKRQDGTGELDGHIDLSVIAEASKKAAIAVLQPGDHVEVFDGEQAGAQGVIDEIHQDVVIITVTGIEGDGQKIELEARKVRKRFKPGDHVKVMTGQNADETGLVVSVTDNVVTFVSDMSMQEVSVFSKDLREAAEVGSGTNIVGNYELHDFVQLDAQTVGIIYKTERDSFRVLDQNGQTRLVQPHQISMRRDSNRAIATDSEGHELRPNDMVKEVDGEGRKGQVLHIHQSFFAFLHNREIVENGGVFVTRCRSLASLAPKGNMPKPGADLSKMNPSMAAPTGMIGSGALGRGPRDRDIGLTVCVVQGLQKGYVGTIRDVTGTVARVELRTGNKLISIEKSKLRERLPDGRLGNPLTGRGSSARVPGGFNQGGMLRSSHSNPGQFASGRTPAWNAIGRTPNPYADGGGKTPAWNVNSRTPNPYADGGKTPAWNVNSRTPNPYAGGADGGRTPAWNMSARTPNPYAAGGSGAAPGGWGGGTPGRRWGGASPKRTPDAWGPALSAPTPAADNAMNTPSIAMTPGGVYSSTTPSANYWTATSAPTPAPGVYGPSPDDDEPDAGSQDKGWDWIFDNALANYLQRIRIYIHGTRITNYLDGEYEDKKGLISAASKSGADFEQTVMVKFDSGEHRPISAQYVLPLLPAAINDEGIVIKGEHKGNVVVVREKPEKLDEEDGVWFVSFSQDLSVKDVKGSDLAALYPA